MSWFDIVKRTGKSKGTGLRGRGFKPPKDSTSRRKENEKDILEPELEELTKEKKPMDRVSTTASKLPQDEEAAKRTEENESELLAQMRARNKETRETLRGEKNE